MTIVDLTKDPVLVLLLGNLIRGASKISIHDNALNQKVNELKAFYHSPKHVVCESLISTIDQLREILSGYDLEHSKNDENISDDTTFLPNIIFNFKAKLEDLKARTALDEKHFSLAEIEVKCNIFNKKAQDSYFESAKDQIISKLRAFKEVMNHGGDIEEFLKECGEHEHYDAQKVLMWLGY